MLFEHNRIKPNFVKEIYSQIIACGFDFKSGYWFHKDANFDEIIEWNQGRLESGFRLGLTQHVKHGYMQILFESKYFSELRGYWIYSDKDVVFNLIVPESDILDCEGGSYFIESKITPMKSLAIKLWESNAVDAIQTNLELDYGYYNLPDILTGKNISVNPFAILPEDAFGLFLDNYFDGRNSHQINNYGMFIESDGTVQPFWMT